MSNFILNEAEQIGAWQVTGPYGTFTPTTDTYRSHHVVLFAGGSGITPLYSIARSLTGKSEDLKVTLIYSCHSIDEIIFRSQLGQFKAKWGEKMDIYYAISEADTLTDLAKATWIRGRLDKSKIKDLLEQVVERPHLGVHYFICGPAELMRMQREILEMLQVPDHNIYMERFAPGPADDAVEIPQDTQEVLLHFYEQSNLLEVSAGKTILSAALEDRIALPYSCKAGNCGVCVAKLTSGKVIMTNNYALKQTDINNGLILLCQSYPCTDDVTVEIE
jgi:ring-1,2-phenylacetyl-CoA epoxidase subunit PaaE